MLGLTKHALIGMALALALVGCEQRPGNTDPPPTTPADRSPDTSPTAAKQNDLAPRLG
jgi:hypothetical protein